MNKKFYLVIRPSMKGTAIPVYYYTFAENEEDAIHKVSLKWGEYDDKSSAKELKGEELDDLVIATDYFG